MNMVKEFFIYHYFTIVTKNITKIFKYLHNNPNI